MKSLLALLLFWVISSAALAQTTGAINPNQAAGQPSGNEDVPPGGCMPIGVTAAGEVVFPFQCKGFLERHGGGTAREQKPAAVEEQKPATPEEQKPAAKQAEGAAPLTASRNLTGADPATFTAVTSRLTEDQLSLDRGQRRDVQRRLNGLGFEIKVTGNFAEKTRSMIKRWQVARGYPPTGYLNELQHKALMSE